MEATCERTNLVSNGIFRVDRCSCGALHMHVGALTLKLAQDAMESLSDTLAEAMAVNQQLCQQSRGPTLQLVPPPVSDDLEMDFHQDTDALADTPVAHNEFSP